MTVLWLMVNPTETLSEKATVFLLQSITNVFIKCNNFITKYHRTETDIQTLAGNLISAVVWEKCHCNIVTHKFLSPLQAYDKGDIFPIWGECLGLELLSLLISGCDLQVGQFDQDLFSDTDAKNVSLKLILPKGWWCNCFIIYANDNVANQYFNSIIAVPPLFLFSFGGLRLPVRWIRVTQ